MSAEWYYLINGQQQGPVDERILQEMIASGSLGANDLVWRDGMAQWAPASQTELFQASPQQPAVPQQEQQQFDPYAQPLGHGQSQPHSVYNLPGAWDQQGQPVDVNYGLNQGHAGYAGFWKRFAAYLIDQIILIIPCIIMIFIVGFIIGIVLAVSGQIQSDADIKQYEPMFNIVGNVVGIFIAWLYHAFMESSKYQGSVGKLALGIKVVDLAGNRISFGKATGRHFAKIPSLLILLMGFFMAGFTEKKQALHDMMAGCLVVNRPGR